MTALILTIAFLLGLACVCAGLPEDGHEAGVMKF